MSRLIPLANWTGTRNTTIILAIYHGGRDLSALAVPSDS